MGVAVSSFSLSPQIYVVMEKMNGDMLEMILNSENSRLTERMTKYMIYQVSQVTPHPLWRENLSPPLPPF